MKVRQDAWSHEDDLLLAETVLRYIREGGTQLGAFEEVGDKLNRTSAACGFRWNADVRKRYEQAIAIAKKQRKERKRALEKGIQQNIPLQQVSLTEEDLDDEITEDSKDIIDQKQLPVATLVAKTAPSSIQSISLDDCILFLTNLKQQDKQSVRFQMENSHLKKENEKLLQEKKELEKKLEKLTDHQTVIQEDYQALVKIMDRARKMVLFEDNELISGPTFKMDKNGNLEQIAH